MKKRLFALVLAICLFAATGLLHSGARAESYTVYVVSNTLKVYKRASTSSGTLGTMAFGESMTCLAANSGWAAVKNSKGAIGYCKISGLSNVNPNTLNTKAYIKSASTPVYRRPDTGSAVMAKLKQNSSYTAVAVTKDGNWARLKNGSAYGYVQVKHLSRSPASAAPSLNTTVYVAANTLAAYDRASTSGKSLGTMSYGESMTLLAASGGWARIRNAAGATGYCKLSGLTATNPNTLSQVVYINANGAKAYRKPSTSAGVMQTLKLNAKYTAVAMTPDGAWARLKNGNYYGYVQTKYLATAPTSGDTETAVYVSSNTLAVYAAPSTSGKALGTLSFGESLTLLNVDDGWAKVRNASGTVGYCAYGGLTTTDPNNKTQACYAAKDGVKLYARPLASASVVQTVPANTSLMVVAVTEDGVWARILLSSGSYAYAQTEDLTTVKGPEDNSPIQDIEPRAVYVADTNLSFYAANSTGASVLGTASFGEALTCTGLGGGWARVVNASGAVGYCEQSGLTSTNPNTYSQALYAQSQGVKVYQRASTASAVLTTLSLNAQVTGVALSSDRSWVRLYNGSAYGYAQSSDLATSPAGSGGNSKIDAILTLAKSLQGVPYKYAAQTPSDGFDCSGFTYYVFRNAAGISLKRTAKTQGYNESYEKISSRSSLKAGDLVFFNTVSDDDDLCDHVGIYLGNSQFIHASSAAGKVTISSLGSSERDYYYRTYSWGRRIIS